MLREITRLSIVSLSAGIYPLISLFEKFLALSLIILSFITYVHCYSPIVIFYVNLSVLDSIIICNFLKRKEWQKLSKYVSTRFVKIVWTGCLHTILANVMML